jgi:N-acetylglucosaminyldiphosphoundecaprenol N-acetyl-beta-D-mannosaminyltransferase
MKQETNSLGLQTRKLGGLRVVRASPPQAVAAVLRRVQEESHSGLSVHLINAYSIALARRDRSYRSALSGSAVNFPDGKPLSWVTRFSQVPLQQVRGPGFFNAALDEGRSVDAKHFLLGGSDELLLNLRSNLEARYPGVDIVGSYSPPFRTLTMDEYEAQDARISASGADIVWVGLGTPKQDHEVERLAERLPVIACAVGAAFDFAAGMKKEAPRWMTAVGVEWLFRLATEPRRLWRRYLFGNIGFIVAVVKER